MGGKNMKKKQIAKSISMEDFRNGNFDKKRNVEGDHPVLVFLKKDKRGHNIGAIMKDTGMKEEAIRSMLRKFVKKGKVTHKQPFFAFKR